MEMEKIIANLIQRVENRYYGKYRGIVHDNADNEKLGRLKLKVPSVLGEDVITGWAMPCVPYGGDADQGFLFIPEIGAGVWVEFEEGDLEFPIWVGTYWSKPGGESELPKPDGSNENPITQKIIKTKKGHTIQLEDADGEEKIIISHKEGAFFSIDKDGSVVIGNQKGSTIVLNAKDENMMLIEQHGNTVTMTEDKLLIVNESGGGAIELSGDMARIVAKDIILQGTQVTLGSGAMFTPVVVDEVLKNLLNIFLTTHVHASAVGPTGPPTPPGPQLMPGAGLSSAVMVK